MNSVHFCRNAIKGASLRETMRTLPRSTICRVALKHQTLPATGSVEKGQLGETM